MKALLRDVGSEWLTISPRARLAIASALLLPAVAALTFSMLVAPADFSKRGLAWFPRCPYKLGTGHDCPTCGVTRAFCAFSHGHFAEGVKFNRTAALPYGLCWVASLGYLTLLTRYPRADRRNTNRRG